MSLLYPASDIPEEDRCPDCEGTGDEWAEVPACCGGSVYSIECACGGQSQMEPVGECLTCGGTGRPTDEQWEGYHDRISREARGFLGALRLVAS